MLGFLGTQGNAYVLTWPIPLSPQAFDPEIVPPALERPGTCLNTSHCLRARDQGHLRVADENIALCLVAVIRDGRGLEEGLAISV